MQRQESQLTGTELELLHELTILEAAKTPTWATIRKGKALCRPKHEWPIDKELEPIDNAEIEGVDISDWGDAFPDKDMLSGRVQKMVRSLLEEEQLLDYDEAGIDDPWAMGMAKMGRAMKLDWECAFHSDQDSVLGSKTVKGKFRGFGSWVQSTAQTDLPVPEAYRTPAAQIYTGALSALTESAFVAILSSLFDQVKQEMDWTMYCHINVQNHIGNFTEAAREDTNTVTGIRTFTQSAESGTITRAVKLYKGNGGTVAMAPHFNLAQFTSNSERLYRGHIMRPQHWMVHFNKPLTWKDLEDAGAGERGFWRMRTGVKCLCPPYNAKIRGTSA